jgi:YesN/AraC family two-component response regulator
MSDMEEMKLKIKRLEIQQRVSFELLAENGLPIADAVTQVAARLRQRLPTILIVDDEESIRVTISRALKDYNVIEAANGEEGMQKIQEHAVDLVISDLYMPDFDGFQLLEALRNENSNIPVVGISGFVDSERAKSLGFDAFLIKPFVFADLLSTISELRKTVDEKDAALPETAN